MDFFFFFHLSIETFISISTSFWQNNSSCSEDVPSSGQGLKSVCSRIALLLRGEEVGEISWEDNVNGHPGLTFLVTQSPLQSAALLGATRCISRLLFTKPVSSRHLLRNDFNKMKPNVAQKKKKVEPLAT